MPKNTEKKPRVLMIRTRMIRPPDTPNSPVFDENKMAGLTESIRHNGIIQPLFVTREPLELWYTLVAGRRRFEAARRLGLEEIPAQVIPAEQAAHTALFENLYRQDPNCFETAALIAQLARKTGIKDTAELAAKVGLGEDETREKLRLLTLDRDRIDLCRAAKVTQQAANRLLAMPKSEQDKLFFGLLNPSREIEDRAALLRERLGLDAAETPRRTVAVKDVRIFFNTIEKAVEIMKQAGIEATAERHDYDGLIEYFIKIPSSSENRQQPSVASGA